MCGQKNLGKKRLLFAVLASMKVATLSLNLEHFENRQSVYAKIAQKIGHNTVEPISINRLTNYILTSEMEGTLTVVVHGIAASKLLSFVPQLVYQLEALNRLLSFDDKTLVFRTVLVSDVFVNHLFPKDFLLFIDNHFAKLVFPSLDKEGLKQELIGLSLKAVVNKTELEEVVDYALSVFYNSTNDSKFYKSLVEDCVSAYQNDSAHSGFVAFSKEKITKDMFGKLVRKTTNMSDKQGTPPSGFLESCLLVAAFFCANLTASADKFVFDKSVGFAKPKARKSKFRKERLFVVLHKLVASERPGAEVGVRRVTEVYNDMLRQGVLVASKNSDMLSTDLRLEEVQSVAKGIGLKINHWTKWLH